MKVKPDVDRCALPFKGAVVIPQNNVQDCPVKQRLHLNLQGEKKKAGSNRTRFNTMQKKKILQMQNYRCDSSGARTSGLMNISNAFPKTDATLASNQAPPPPPVPTSNQSFRDCINIYKHSVLMAAGIVCQRWPGAPRALCIFE